MSLIELMQAEWAKLYPQIRWPGPLVAFLFMGTDIAGMRLERAVRAEARGHLRAYDEINDAHDLLTHLFNSDKLMAKYVQPEMREAIEVAGEVLCWVLGHDREGFGQTINMLSAKLIADLDEDFQKAKGGPDDGKDAA